MRENLLRQYIREILLKEFKYGKELLADPSNISGVNRINYEDWLDSKGIEQENNTEDEKRLFNTLVRWLRTPLIYRNNDKAVQIFKKLFPLKSRFPHILDPDLPSNTSLYRGGSIGLDQVTSIIQNNTLSKGLTVNVNLSSPMNIESRATRGFISLTPEVTTAEMFTDKNVIKKLSQARWPATVVTQYSMVQDKCLFNPNFMDVIGGFDEEEVLYFNNLIPATRVKLRKPTSPKIEKFFKQNPDSPMREFYELFLSKLS